METVQKWRNLIDLKILLFAGFLMLPNLKADDSRFDWLVLGPEMVKYGVIAVTLGVILHVAWKSGPLHRRNLLTGCLVFLLFAIPAFWASTDTYGSEKIEKLFTLTLISMLGPVFLIRTEQDLRRLYFGLTLAGLVYGISAVVTFASGVNQSYRMTAMNSNPITVGRAAGFPLICFALLGLSGRIRQIPAILISLSAFFMVLGSGSRGPLLSSLFAVGLCTVLFFRHSLTKAHFAKALLFIAAIGAVLATFEVSLPPVASNRMISFAQGKFGDSELARAEAYEMSFSQIPLHPQGIGWGSFDDRINLWRDGEKLSYPHNLFLEIFLEAGWLVGLIVIYLVARGLKTAHQGPKSPERIMLFGFLVYFLANSMVSGDINSNRIVLSFLMIALCLPYFEDAGAAAGESKPSTP